MHWTKERLKLLQRIMIVLMLAWSVRLVQHYDVMIWELILVFIGVLVIRACTRILNLSDGMLYQMLRGRSETDFISDKILKHTLTKKNKRYKIKKKRPRRAR